MRNINIPEHQFVCSFASLHTARPEQWKTVVGLQFTELDSTDPSEWLDQPTLTLSLP
jgi:hypothetical protein